MQSGEPKARAWSLTRKILVGVLLAALGFVGLGAMASGVGSSRIANGRQQPLAPLSGTIDLSASYQDGPPYAVEDGELVHVEGLLRADPPLQSLGGQSYALQQLRVDQGSVSRVLRVAGPGRLWLCVDLASEPGASGRVEVRLPHLWTGDEISAGSKRGVVGVAGTIPNNVALMLSPEMPISAPEAGQRWTLWAIGQGERVTVVSRARHEAGRIVLSSERGEACIVSQRPWPSLMGDANIHAVCSFVFGALCLLPLAQMGWKWARLRAAST